MLKSAIDLGTNTALLLVADVDGQSGRVTRVIHDQSTIVRLGQSVDQTGELHPDAMERTRACLRGYAAKLIGLGLRPSECIAVATATARDAQNGEIFFESIAKEFGIRFRTISGMEEAHAMFVGGLLPEMNSSHSVVIDIGGGSTEFKTETRGISLQMGSVRFTERYLKSDPVTDEEFWATESACDTELRRAKVELRLEAGFQLVGVAGTVTTLGSLHHRLSTFDPKALDGTVLTRGDVHRMVEELKWRSIRERKEMSGMESARADVLLAGALILWRAMEVLNFPTLTVSTRGLRYGILALSESRP